MVAKVAHEPAYALLPKDLFKTVMVPNQPACPLAVAEDDYPTSKAGGVGMVLFLGLAIKAACARDYLVCDWMSTVE